jgi:glutamine synthetase type III
VALPNNVTDTLVERGNRYGNFVDHAEVTQRLKNVIASELGRRGKSLAADQQEALDMICHKIGRIVNGDPNYSDSWHDIAGYAQLVDKRLQGTVL